MADINPHANICQRISQLRVEHAGARGKASFARRLGISPSTYDYYETSRVPPADILVRIADLTGADLRWLLTGEEGTPSVAASHPALARAARLLADQPRAADALAAFLDLLAETSKFPAEKANFVENQPIEAKSPNSAPVVGQPVPADHGFLSSPHPDQSDPSAEARLRQGWIPIIGRSAAGIPHFWHDTGEGSADVTMLADLVNTMKPQPARHIHQAEAVGELGGDETAAQLVLLDSPQPPGTAEFIVSEHISRRYDPVFAVRIDGQSMEPEICHGDVVVLSPNCPAEQGKPAVIQLADQIGVTCKLYRTDEEFVHLIPINEQFSPTSFPKDQLVWALKVLARVRSV